MEKKKRKKPLVDLVALRKAVAEAMGNETGEKEGGEGEYSALRRDQPIETFGEGRKCVCCGCSLARSNPDKLCMPCDTIIAEWKNFPWNRGEIGRRMAKYCLDYVLANSTRRKARHGVGRGMSSGSFARAAGRKTIVRKKK